MSGSLTSMMAQVFNASGGSVNMRYRTHPNDAAGVAVADDSAWDEIIASTVITTAFHHLAGLGMYHVGATADNEEQVGEGVGGADGAATAAGVTLVMVAIATAFTATTAAGEREVDFKPWMLPVPLRVETASPGTTDRHAAEISTSATAGIALLMSISVITGMGE